MKKLFFALVVNAISSSYTSAFRPGHEGRINTPWTPTPEITIGQNTFTMIEELLKDTRPELISKIGKLGSNTYAAIMPGLITAELQKDIKECLGDDIFDETPKKLP